MLLTIILFGDFFVSQFLLALELSLVTFFENVVRALDVPRFV